MCCISVLCSVSALRPTDEFVGPWVTPKLEVLHQAQRSALGASVPAAERKKCPLWITPPVEPQQIEGGPERRNKGGEKLHIFEQLERSVRVRLSGCRFGVARQTVSAVLERHGVARRYRILTPQDIDAVVRLYESGLSLAAVGARLGVNASTILCALRATGVQMRPVGTNQWR